MSYSIAILTPTSGKKKVLRNLRKVTSSRVAVENEYSRYVQMYMTVCKK